MKKNEIKQPSYPTFNEYQRKQILNIATAVGVGFTTVAFPFSLNSAEEAPVEKKTDNKTEAEQTKDQIILFIAKLGHKDFKERDNATKTLITIAKQLEKNKQTVLSVFLKKELEKCTESKDPEVKKRANLIIAAITQKSVKSPPKMMGVPPRPAGGMPAPRPE